MHLSSGSKVGHYKIVSPIGKGGMGEVFLAQDTKLERRVALKILPAEFAEDADRMSRFVREAKSASSLNHPNIITIYEISESGGTHYIATEYIDGKTLSQLLREKNLELPLILDIAIQAVSALDEAHQAGVIHRDIKPDNIMIRPNGLVKVLDFGLAKFIEKQSKVGADFSIGEEDQTLINQSHTTQPGMIMGTPKYMSPEQARGKKLDRQTDIFSIGAVLYEMLSGAAPFDGETLSDILAAVLMQEPSVLKNVPNELAEIVGKALEKDKQKRYQTAGELLADLKDSKQEAETQNRLKKFPYAPQMVEAQTQISNTPANNSLKPKSSISNLQSIAVLPFANMSAGGEDNEYFCDGLAEELLNALSKIENLKVAARTSAFSFKGKNANISEIGEKLSVKNVLEGSVRRAGNRLRISVQLINAADGYQIWSERYDREMTDIFELQDEITLSIIDALKVKLLDNEKAEIFRRYTENADAYEFFLKGRYQSYKYSEEGWKRAVEFFEKAIKIQPDYAPAYAGIAAAVGCLWFFGFLPAEKGIVQSKANAARALEIDENLAEAYLSQALATYSYDWNWEKADREFKQSITLNPNYAEGLSHYAIFLVFLGRYEEAVSCGKRALEIDPLSPLININVGWAYFSLGLSDEALKLADKIIEVEPDLYGAYWLKGAIRLSEGEYKDAVEELKKAVARGGRQTVLSDLGSAFALMGERLEAEKILAQLLEMRRTEYAPAICLARVYSRLRDNDKTIEWLEKAFQERNGEMVFLKSEIEGAAEGDALHSLAADPRLIEILDKMNLP